MKIVKRLSLFLLVMLFCVSVPFGAFAQTTEKSQTEVQYFEDGSYLVIETQEEGISLFASGTKSKSKIGYYYDGDDNELRWSVTLSATFSYTGSSATCTSASTSYKIYDSAWKVKEATASRSGRTATGDFLVKKYWLGIITKTVPLTLTISCDNNGNIS